jgi:site-specific DNA-methyltransferase (adenine-specific)
MNASDPLQANPLQGSFSLRGRNPDVLTCIANLSNDEVFTPPEFANRMLDTLAAGWAAGNRGADLWADSTVRFLDPCTKSGVFLRQIATRLIAGLAAEIPDLQTRVDHILTKQLFGIGITRLTSLLARRSLYCSKHAGGEHSVAKSFYDDDGNIWFERTEHDQVGNKCQFCSAPRELCIRGPELDNYAYAFIHTDDIKAYLSALFGGDMQFDVIIGNPPYQMAGGAGGTSDSSIYHLFIEQAIRLEPRYVSMVTPARWIAGGRGMDDFRRAILGGEHLRELVDFPASAEVFPGVEIKAGVCYFLWDKHHEGDCNVTTVRGGENLGPVSRKLDEYDIFVRDARAMSILHKVLGHKEAPINSILTRDTPFGLASNFDDIKEKRRQDYVALYYIRKMKRGIGFVDRKTLNKNTQYIDSWKVLVPEAYNGGDGLPHQILGRSVIASPPSVCTQSFLAFYVTAESEAQSLQSYYTTRFFRFLVSQRKITQHGLHSTYSWVPIQAWDRTWTDAELYQKYGLTEEEIAFIESMIRPMAGADE